ncbi:Ubiquitinyl hydrolase 1 [Purpureocillium takamizusanense]|uniref:Ubiquitinyl hydrolase 1 n=1 Tax=Purpureocillium takamizusanense TaxID=2060973 RepID=A0A9Q8QIL6_9HYPO|nr:Ubiquitinyl hydrolase 1 [Purpureocillium takamizusanense]UNI20488.1 Ubiquitinyl hydrolase 1 [Purpureocillium takamizusanense]
MSGLVTRGTALAKWLLPATLSRRGPERRGMLVGLDAAGKTTLLYRWKLGETVTTIPTVGFNVETVSRDGGFFDLVLWDIGGGDRIRPLFRHYIPSTEYIIFIHDCADHERRDEQLDEFNRVAQTLADADGRFICVIFNKQDLLPPAKRRRHVADLARRYEEKAATYAGKLAVDVLNLPGLSATKSSDADLHVVLDHVQETLRHGPKPRAAAVAASAVESRLVVKVPRPDVDDLKREAQRMVDADGLSADEFWQALERGDLQDTMTIFWLLQLHLSAAKYVRETKLDRPLRREDFASVLLHAPELSDPGLWRDYFSRDRLFSPDAHERWLFPDLQSLPPISAMPFSTSAATPMCLHEEPDESDRLVSFALAVAQKQRQPIGTEEYRGGSGDALGHALAALQSSIMRARTTDRTIAPYSATKAHFWIQFVRACLGGVVMPPSEGTEDTRRSLNPAIGLAHGGGAEIELDEFRDIFGITGEEWRGYYSRVVWEGVPARVAFAKPDLKPLPHALAVKTAPRSSSMASAQQPTLRAAKNFIESLDPSHGGSGTHDVAAADIASDDEAQPPSRSEDDLALMAAAVIDEAEIIALEDTEGSLVKGNSHARMLLRLYRVLAAEETSDEGAMAAALQVPCPGVDGVTQRTFWARRLHSAWMGCDGRLGSFEEFVDANRELADEELPLAVYSHSLWAGEEARRRFIEADRRPLAS